MGGDNVYSQHLPAPQQPTDRGSASGGQGQGDVDPEAGGVRQGGASRAGVASFSSSESMRLSSWGRASE